jgi:hypothetical protein
MCNSQKKLPVGDGDDPGLQLLGYLICLFTLIINIYGLGVGISTIKKTIIFKNLLLVNQQCQKIVTWHITLINIENRNPV